MDIRASGPILTILNSVPVEERAIDVGSGNGRIVNHLRRLGWTVEGVELDGALALAAGVDTGNVLDWEPTSPADLVTCIELIEHLDPQGQVQLLDRLCRWVTRSGTVVLSTPQRHSPVALFERVVHRLRPHLGPYHWWDPTHIGVLPRRRLERLIRDANFEIVDRIGIHFAPDLIPIPGLVRAAHRGPLSGLGWDLVYVLRRFR